jgi:ABC-2 type transport system permease protein
VVFLPAALNGRDRPATFMRQNLLPVVNLYGLLLLSDALLLNALGFDRGAAQAYFVTPISLETVLKAKNLTAIVFIVLQSAIILCISTIARVPISKSSIISGLLASTVVTVYLLSAGNYTSLAMPRSLDPRQTFKKQAGAKMQIWLLGCSLGLFVLVGFAFLARYAFQSDWALFGVLTVELIIGLFLYHLGLQSAVERGMHRREEIVQTLSRSGSPMNMG